MECIIPGNNLKVLGRALQALAKIGDELFMAMQKDKLILITLNTTKTVCVQFHIFESFFSCYEINGNVLSKSKDQSIACKIHMKIFLPLFKGNIEKKFDFFKIEYEHDGDFLVLKMKYKCDDVVMMHKLRLMNNESLPFGVLPLRGPNKISASSSFCSQLLTMFNVSDDEITLEVMTRKVIVRNYCIGAPCSPKMMRSQISLNSTEFLGYNINNETSLNFTLKPFRTAIHFAEAFGLNVDLSFETDGKPLTISLTNPTFEINFIVSTLNCESESLLSTSATPVSQQKEVSTEGLAIDSENWNSFDEILKRNNPKLPEINIQGEAENTDLIPNSPESPKTKRTKLVFQRCYEQTFNETMLGEVLAANSDSD